MWKSDFRPGALLYLDLGGPKKVTPAVIRDPLKGSIASYNKNNYIIESNNIARSNIHRLKYTSNKLDNLYGNVEVSKYKIPVRPKNPGGVIFRKDQLS